MPTSAQTRFLHRTPNDRKHQLAYLPPGGRCREATDEECGQKSHSPYKSMPPPHHRPVILSEQSESKDLRTDSTQNVTFVRRSLHSLRSVEMTELLVRWRSLRFLYRQIVARIPHPALRATFPPGEGFVVLLPSVGVRWYAGGVGRCASIGPYETVEARTRTAT